MSKTPNVFFPAFFCGVSFCATVTFIAFDVNKWAILLNFIAFLLNLFNAIQRMRIKE